MANLLKTAGEWLGAQFNEHAATDVTYKRGTASASVTAHKGRCQLNVGGEVIRLGTEWRDWFIDYDDLVLTGHGRTLPEEGDLIEELDGSVIYVYEVMIPAAGDRHYDWTSADRRRLRVHTKQIKTR